MHPASKSVPACCLSANQCGRERYILMFPGLFFGDVQAEPAAVLVTRMPQPYGDPSFRGCEPHRIYRSPY